MAIVLKGAWKSYRREFEVYIAKFRKHCKHVEKEAGLAHMIESARMREVQLANRDLEVRNGKLRRRHCILAALLATDYRSMHSKLSALRHPDTNTWIYATPEYIPWYTSQKPDCLCCYGIPGSGKSVLSASIVDALVTSEKEPTALIIYFYCDYAEPATLDPTRLVSSLIKQCLEQLPLDRFTDTFNCPFQEGNLVPCLPTCIQFLKLLLEDYDKVYLVLDGIDQLTADGQCAILTLIGDLLRLPRVAVKVIVTSGSENHVIKHTLRPHKTLLLTKARVQVDISLFIEEQIESIVGAQNPLLRNERLRKEVIDALLAGASEM